MWQWLRAPRRAFAVALSDAASLSPAAAAAAVFAQALAVFPAAFVLFRCLWRCRKAAAFPVLLFKGILEDAATAVHTSVTAAAPAPPPPPPATVACTACDPRN